MRGWGDEGSLRELEKARTGFSCRGLPVSPAGPLVLAQVRLPTSRTVR